MVQNLGCGLDTRVSRIEPSSDVAWFDVDFPEVIREWQNFYSNHDGYQMIGSSVTAPEWLERVPKDRPGMTIADGIFEYLTESEFGGLLNRITDHFPTGQIAFDVMNSFAMKSGRKKLKEGTGAEHKCTVDVIRSVDDLDSRLRRISNLPVLASKHLPLKCRVIFGAGSVWPNVRNTIRLLRYEFKQTHF